ncbi:thiamine kinase [Izhakiella capsodis]|uniref:Thiamine kinase n=2 Tax=Izhakiella capsodis TaxID=1367852 RepID=A0A1I4UTA4_9GAMM|nr:thiamine kinase [Izhakiella capsodis]
MIKQVFPAAQAVGSAASLQGLTGLTYRLEYDGHPLIARRQPQAGQEIPGVNRQREYHLLRKLAADGLAPVPLGWKSPWLLLEWTPGENAAKMTAECFEQQLLPLLCRLHRLPPVGSTLNLPALLWRYWQLCHPREKSARWLRQLKRLTRSGLPSGLRKSLLHLDIHRGNLLQTPQGLRLIDWEYAAEGDVALELCMLRCGDVIASERWSFWLDSYAHAMSLNPGLLALKIERWRPWVQLLMASWYSLRASQSQDEALILLAREALLQIEQEQ